MTIAKIRPVIARLNAIRTALAIVFFFRADNRPYGQQDPRGRSPEQKGHGNGTAPEELTDDEAATNQITHLAKCLRGNVSPSSS